MSGNVIFLTSLLRDKFEQSALVARGVGNPDNHVSPWYETTGIVLEDLCSKFTNISVSPRRDIEAAKRPDFALTRKIIKTDTDGKSKLFLDFPLLCEVKRREGTSKGISKGAKQMTAAQKQLEHYASFVFEMFPDQATLILLAVSGVFWSFKVVDRRCPAAPSIEDEPDEELDYDPKYGATWADYSESDDSTSDMGEWSDTSHFLSNRSQTNLNKIYRRLLQDGGVRDEESCVGDSSAGGGDRDEETTGKAKSRRTRVCEDDAGSSHQNKKVRTRKQ